MRRRCENGVIWLTAAFFVMFVVIAANYFTICFEQKYVSAAEERSEFTISAGESQGTIYDRNMRPLNNTGHVYKAVVVPKAVDYAETVRYAIDSDEFSEKFREGEPSIIPFSGALFHFARLLFHFRHHYSIFTIPFLHVNGIMLSGP